MINFKFLFIINLYSIFIFALPSVIETALISGDHIFYIYECVLEKKG